MDDRERPAGAEDPTRERPAGVDSARAPGAAAESPSGHSPQSGGKRRRSLDEELYEVLVLAAAEDALLGGSDTEPPTVPSWGRVDEQGRLWVPLGMGAPDGWVLSTVQTSVAMPPAVVALPLLDQRGSVVGRRAQMRLDAQEHSMRRVDLRVTSEVYPDPDNGGASLVRLSREGDWYDAADGKRPLETVAYDAAAVWVEQYVPQPPQVQERPAGNLGPDAAAAAIAANAWLNRVRDVTDSSALLRRPVPAREVAHLIGRRVLCQEGGEWVDGLRAVSEPVWIEDQAHVYVMDEPQWYRWQVHAVSPYPLTHVWVES